MKKSFITCAAVMLAAFSINSCSNEDCNFGAESSAPVVVKTLTDSLCGEWYNKHSFGYDVESMNSDGTYHDWTTIFLDGITFNERNTGTWTVEGKSYSYDYVSAMLGQQKSSLEITNITDYNKTTKSPTDGSISVYSRIVDEITIKAGETSKITIPSPYDKLVPTTYESDYAWVASVDGNGSVTGKERGMTYVMASDNSGNSVVVKVNVTSDNAIPDFVDYIGKNVDELTLNFDKSIGYFEKKGSGKWDMYTIVLRDDVISQIGFTTPSGSEEIDMITVDLTKATDLDAINREFAGKYTKIEDTNGNYYFDGEVESAEHKMFVDNATRTITFSANKQKADGSLVPDFSGIAKMNVAQFLETFNFTIDEEEIDTDYDDQMVYIYPSNPAVSYGFLSFSLSTGAISSVSLYMNQDVTSEEEVNAYLESVYNKFVSGNNVYYGTGTSLLTSDVWISCKINSRGKLNVSFVVLNM